MGAAPSQPLAGATLRVIGVGLPRTGTTSFSLALEKLLGGPCYHGGTQMTLGSEANVQDWIYVLRRSRYQVAGEREAVLKRLMGILSGYAATTDCPSAQFCVELLELYPQAIVICTVRDPDRWAESMADTAYVSFRWFLGAVLAPVPTMRWYVTYLDALLRGRWGELYRREGEGWGVVYSRSTWDRHMAYLKTKIHPDRLHFFDVRDGWAPLCKILNVPVPNEPFPMVNDRDAMESFARQMVWKGLVSWLLIFVIIAASSSCMWHWWAK